MRVSLGFYRLLLYVAFTRVAYSLLTTAAIQKVEQTDYDEREWRCQHSGICSWYDCLKRGASAVGPEYL